jgi:hypothetical protein
MKNTTGAEKLGEPADPIAPTTAFRNARGSFALLTGFSL